MEISGKYQLVQKFYTTNKGETRSYVVPKNDNDIVWTAWSNGGKVLHIIDFMCGKMTPCGYVINDNWHTAWGIPDNIKFRMCLRCMYQKAARMNDSGKWSPPWKMYGRTKTEPASDWDPESW